MANTTVPAKNTGDELSAEELNNMVAAINSKVDGDNVAHDGVIAISQSNAVCMDASGKNSYRDYQDWRILQYSPDGNGTPAVSKELIPATDPLLWPSSAFSLSANGPSAAFDFARKLIEIMPFGKKVVLIPAAIPGVGLYNGPWGVGGDAYNAAIATIQQADATIENFELKYIHHAGGENEAQLPGSVTPTQYKNALMAVIAGLRAATASSNNAFAFITQMVPEWMAADPGTEQRADIDEVHKYLPLDVERCWYIHSPLDAYIAGDLIHRNAAGQRIIAQRMFEKSQSACALSSGANMTQPTGLSTFGATVSWVVPTSDCPAFSVEYRPAGSSDSWTKQDYVPNDYYLPGDTVIYTIEGVSEDIEIRVAGRYFDLIGPYSATIILSHVSVPSRWSSLDMENAGDDTVTFTVPSIGTDTTAWTEVVAKKPTTTTVNGFNALVTTSSNCQLQGPTLLRGAYTKMLLVKHSNFTEQGTYLSSDNFTRHLLWRESGSSKLVKAGHSGAGAEVAATTDMIVEKWYLIALTYNGTDTLNLYINGVLIDTGTTSLWSESAVGQTFNALYPDGNGGNNATYLVVDEWVTELTQGQIDWETSLLSNKFKITLG